MEAGTEKSTDGPVGRQVILGRKEGGSTAASSSSPLQALVNVTTSVGSVAEGGGIDAVMGHVYFYLTIIASFLSIVGCSLLLITFVLFRELRSTGRKLLVCLSVADFLTAVGNFIGIMWYTEGRAMDSATGSKILCQFHASLTIFSSISSFLWTASIAIHLYVCISLGNSRLADKLFRPFLVVCWTFPAVIGIVAWSLDVLGNDPTLNWPSWCWISPNVMIVSTLFWQYVTGKAWEIACYFHTVILYALIKYTLQKQKPNRNRLHPTTDGDAANRPNESVIAEANRKLIFVPVIFIVLRIWGTIRFIVGAHFRTAPAILNALAWIVPLQGIGDSIQGFANCIIFLCLTKRARQRCIAAAVSRCDCSRKHPNAPQLPTSSPSSPAGDRHRADLYSAGDDGIRMDCDLKTDALTQRTPSVQTITTPLHAIQCN